MFTILVLQNGEEIYRQSVEDLDIATITAVVNQSRPKRRAPRSDKGTKRKPQPEPTP